MPLTGEWKPSLPASGHQAYVLGELTGEATLHMRLPELHLLQHL